MGWIRNIALKFRKENIFAAIFTISVPVLVLLDKSYFRGHLLQDVWLLLAAVIAMLLIIVMLIAGFAVFRSIVKASAGFTILIFLAQTYCSLESQTPEGVQALTLLWSTGSLYILFEFAKEFQEACKENLSKLGDDKKRWEGKLMIALFILFAVVYMVVLYKVLNPIIQSLCIYP